MFKRLLEWDCDTFIYLNALGIEKYDAFWATITDIATWTPLFLLFIALFVFKFPRKEAIYQVLTVLALALFITLITHLTKEWIARLRPNNNEEINTFIRILKTPSGYSFFLRTCIKFFFDYCFGFSFVAKESKMGNSIFYMALVVQYE